MIPVSVEELTQGNYRPNGGLPEGYDCTLIRMGLPIQGTHYFESVPEDLTQSGYFILNEGTDQERRIYKTQYQPSAGWMYGDNALVDPQSDDNGYIANQTARYRKIEHITYGVVWELIPESITSI